MTDKRTLTTEEITAEPSSSRRSFLARTGLIVAAAATIGLGSREAAARSDRPEQTDNDPNPPNGDHREQTDQD
jgi:hypothetical protein